MRELFAERGEPPAPSSTPPAPAATTAPKVTASIGSDVELFDPRSGEVLDLTSAPKQQLVDVVLYCRHHEGLMTTWRRACEGELAQRLAAEGKRVDVVGDHELGLDTGRGKEWDGDMLRGVVMDLLEQKIITASTVTGLVRTEVKVDGHAANRLLDQLDGEPRELVAACFHFAQKRRPTVKITPVPDLADALPEGVR